MTKLYLQGQEDVLNELLSDIDTGYYEDKESIKKLIKAHLGCIERTKKGDEDVK